MLITQRLSNNNTATSKHLCDGGGWRRAQWCRTGASQSSWTHWYRCLLRRAWMWTSGGQRGSWKRRARCLFRVDRTGLAWRWLVTGVYSRGSGGWVWGGIPWVKGSGSVWLEWECRVSSVWGWSGGIWSSWGRGDCGVDSGPSRHRVRMGHSSRFVLAAALKSHTFILLQLFYVLCWKLELHIHHVGTKSQVNGQRWAPRQKVMDLQDSQDRNTET